MASAHTVPTLSAPSSLIQCVQPALCVLQVGGLAALVARVKDADICFTDFSINDVKSPRNVARDPAYATALEKLPAADKLSLTTEALILALRSALPGALHIAMLAQCPMCVGTTDGRARIAAMRASLTFHRIATIDLASACPPHGDNRFCEWSVDYADQFAKHSGWRAHSHYADAAAYAVSAQLCQTLTPWTRTRPGINTARWGFQCANVSLEGANRPMRGRLSHRPGAHEDEPPASSSSRSTSGGGGGGGGSSRTTSRLWPPELHALLPSCLEPLTMFDAYLSASHASTSARPGMVSNGPEGMSSNAAGAELGGGWALMEDRPGKPGFISSAPGAVLRLPVRFGLYPALGVTYLRSYASLGDATLTLNNVSMPLHGLWAEEVSISVTEWIRADTSRSERDMATFRKATSAPSAAAKRSQQSQARHEGEDAPGQNTTTQWEHLGSWGFHIAPGSSHVLELRYVGPPSAKFKLVSVITC